MEVQSMLFSPYEMNGLRLKNRIIMAPMYTGYANPDGTVSPLVIDHYRMMAASGVAMVVVENAAVDLTGSGSPFMLRVDDDVYLAGLAQLAKTIREEGALAVLQINHAGRYAFLPERLAPSPVKTGDVTPGAMTVADIRQTVRSFAEAARRVKEAGFDGVEIHGGTGYLLVQFLSPRTNHRDDEYGGALENRMKFPLQVVDAVMAAVGEDYPVGYRFLADEWLPDGLHLEDTIPFARELEKRSPAYLSVMAGTYDSFFTPDYMAKEKEEGFMAHFAKSVKEAVSVPVIAAGRIQRPETAERLLAEGACDLVGLARVLFADPEWPKKAEKTIDEAIRRCEPTCSLCLKRATSGKPVFCSQWPKHVRRAFLDRVGEKKDDSEAYPA